MVSDKQVRRLEVQLEAFPYVWEEVYEMKVLFIFLSVCYGKRSVMITSYVSFSRWERIFKDPMNIAAAIDRLVHHSIILEMNLPSYRLGQSKMSKQECFWRF